MSARLGLLAVTLGACSLVMQAAIVLWHVDARRQAMALDFPLTALGESTMLMLLPLGASVLSVCLAFFSLRVRAGQYGLVTAGASWIGIWLFMGTEGFRYLF